MEKYIIKNAKYIIGSLGIENTFNGSVQYEHNGQTKWISISELLGFPLFSISDNDITDMLVNLPSEDSPEYDLLEKSKIQSLEGVPVDSYKNIGEALSKRSMTPMFKLLIYTICLVKLDDQDRENFIKETIGKDINEINMFGYLLKTFEE